MAFSTEQKVCEFLRDQGAKDPRIKQIILFGSRARGDALERSDFDIAIETVENLEEESNIWSQWEDDIPTLCEVDLLHLNHLKNDQLRAEIVREGVVIYER